ncbi:hypothetical protein P692DRAFT_201875216 [Suillus brevipes Sb2]|nr:hypothetical protein P692DRAFT_201875216 [Suillus brevipes Sb2]
MELSVCMAIDSVTPDYSTSVSDYEIEQAVLTIAYAMVNPYKRLCEVAYTRTREDAENLFQG